MGFIKPLLAAAAVLAIAAPAASALADPAWGGHGYERPHGAEGRQWREHRYEHDGWRRAAWREHQRREHRYGWRY